MKYTFPGPLALAVIVPLLLSACSGSIPNTGVTASPAAVQSTSAAPAASTASASPQAAATSSTASSSAPQCTAPAAATLAMTEGPYFKAGSPERASLVGQGMAGTRLTLTGYVLTSDCKPVAGALLDFWQADASGQYDNSGYTLRGHQFTDANGRYQLETVVPGEYPGRTEHIHVKVQAPGGPILTTQLFFPGVAHNQSDSIFDPSLLVTVQSSSGSVQASYNFVVNVK